MAKIGDIDGQDKELETSSYVTGNDLTAMLNLVNSVGGANAQDNAVAAATANLPKIKAAGSYNEVNPYFSWGKDGYVKFRANIDQKDTSMPTGNDLTAMLNMLNGVSGYSKPSDFLGGTGQQRRYQIF